MNSLTNTEIEITIIETKYRVRQPIKTKLVQENTFFAGLRSYLFTSRDRRRPQASGKGIFLWTTKHI